MIESTAVNEPQRITKTAKTHLSAAQGTLEKPRPKRSAHPTPDATTYSTSLVAKSEKTPKGRNARINGKNRWGFL